MNYNKARDLIYNFMEMGLGDDVNEIIWRPSNGPQPPLPYASLNISPIESPIKKENIYNFEDASINIISRDTLILNVETRGDGAVAKMHDFKDRVSKPSFRDQLYFSMINEPICFTILSIGSIIDVSGILNTHQEERSELDIELKVSSQVLDTGYCESGLEMECLDISGLFINEEKIVIEKNIEIIK